MAVVTYIDRREYCRRLGTIKGHSEERVPPNAEEWETYGNNKRDERDIRPREKRPLARVYIYI